MGSNWSNNFKLPLFHRFLTKVKIGNKGECWEWLGNKSENGYGKISSGKLEDGTYSCFLASRVSYSLYIGEIGESFVCHHCDNPGCVNPEHLFLGTQQDNMSDMKNKNRGRYSTRTHCKNGHALVGENLRKLKPGSKRVRLCKLCCNERNRKYLKRIKERGLLCQNQ